MPHATDVKHELFNQVMVPHMNLLYGYAMYLTSDRDEANDLLQDTFLKAFRFFCIVSCGTRISMSTAKCGGRRISWNMMTSSPRIR